MEAVQKAFQHRSARVIALCRAVLAFFFALAVAGDVGPEDNNPEFLLLVCYTIFAIAKLAVTWNSWWLETRLSPYAHLIDLIVFTILVFLTDGCTSPFFTFFVFLVLAAAIRWGWREALLTTLVVVVLYIAASLSAGWSPGLQAFEVQRFVVRGANLIVLSFMIIWFGLNQGRFWHGLPEQKFTDSASSEPPMGEAMAYALAGLAGGKAVLAWSIFAALRALGVRLVLDDFGTGYASLANLKRVTFDKIKIDQSFVRSGATDDGRNAAIIKSIVALADGLGMDTTAEDAESLDDVERIRAFGCTQVQGFIFGMPMAPEDALEKALASAANWANREEQERASRVAVLRRGTVHSNGQSYPARIRNLSSGGALIEIDSSARLRNTVEIELSDTDRITGEIRWAQGRRFGVAFAREIDVGEIVGPRGAEVRMPSRPAAGDEDEAASSAGSGAG